MDFVRIDRAAIPPEEHEAARHLEINLMQLQRLASEFRHTVELYLFAHERKLAIEQQGTDEMWPMITWMGIAGRNGAIVAASFQMIMEEINSTNAPKLREKIDLQERKAGWGLFLQEFPNITNIRNSAAHPGELSASERKTEKHRLKEAGQNAGWIIAANSGAFLQDGVTAHEDSLTYSGSFKGKLADYTLSMPKADVLDAVAAHYRAAYVPLESPTDAKMRAALRESGELRRQSRNDRPPSSDNRA